MDTGGRAVDVPSPSSYTRASMREGLAAIMRDAKHVRINTDRLAQVAQLIPASAASRWINAYRDAPEHYTSTLPPMPETGDIQLSDLDVLQWSIVSSSQGFLFWQRDADGTVRPVEMHIEGTTYAGGGGVEASLLRALHRGHDILDANVLANYTMADLEALYGDEMTGRITLQLLDRRLEHFRALGRILLDRFDGHFVNVLRRADGYLYRDNGQGFIQLLMTDFRELFHDDWPICKRPNVDAFGLYMRRRARTFAPEYDRLLDFKDIEKAVPGADYYRPLWFVRTGVFEISDELRHALAHRELIAPGSQMEQEYRAFTIEACLRLADQIGGWPAEASTIVLESHAQPFLRCRRCEVGTPGGAQEGVPCPYSAVCRAYTESPDLMECIWPLALTTAY
jgi:hypothetical protein